MALINLEQKTIHCKIVYYGPGMAGKTSCLQYLRSKTPPDRRGELLSIATETERTLFFDMADPDDTSPRGFKLRFHLYTVPGCTLYERTRVAVLNGADGVVFVADSRKKQLEENVLSLKELARNLTKLDKKFNEFPLVLQYNKRDLPDALPVAVMDKYLNVLSWQRFESSAWVYDEGVSYHAGLGIFDAFYALTRLVIAKL